MNAHSSINPKWKQPKCSSADEWIKYAVYIHNSLGILVIKKTEVLTYAAAWMVLKIVVLNERSQPWKATYCFIIFILNTQSRQTHTSRIYISGFQELWGWSMGSDC